jgi:hypothetical protein
MVTIEGFCFFVLATAVIAVYVVLYRRAEPRLGVAPVKYVSEPPSDLPPAMVGMLFDPEMTPDKLAATVLDLVRRGVLELDKPTARPGEGDDLILRLRRDRVGGLRPFEREFVYELFDHIRSGDEASTGDLRAWWCSHPATSGVIEEILSRRLQQAMAAEGLVEPGSTSPKRLLTFYGIAVAFGVLLVGAIGSWALLFVALSIILVTWTQRLSSASEKGARLAARYEGFRRYIADHGRFRDKPAEAVVIWEDYLPLAIVLGLGAEAEDDIRVGPRFFSRGSPFESGFSDEQEALAYMTFRRRYDPELPALRVTHGRNPQLRFSGGAQSSVGYAGMLETLTQGARREPLIALLAIIPFTLVPAGIMVLVQLLGS